METRMNIKKNQRYENGLLKFENGWYHYNTKEDEMYQIFKEENNKGWSISEHKSGDGFNWTIIDKSPTLANAIWKCKSGMVGLKF